MSKYQYYESITLTDFHSQLSYVDYIDKPTIKQYISFRHQLY